MADYSRLIKRRKVNVVDFPATITFYAASSSGGTVEILNTVVINEYGWVTSWTQSAPAGTPGEWKFNNAVNSGQVLTMGF